MASRIKRVRSLLKEIKAKKLDLDMLMTTLDQLNKQRDRAETLPEDEKNVQLRLLRRNVLNIQCSIASCKGEIARLEEELDEISL